MRRVLTLSVFWRVCLINGGVLALGTLALVLSPATVSSRPLLSETVVLTVGLAVTAVLNALLLRSVLRPIDRLIGLMATVDVRQPGPRLDETGAAPADALVSGFNAMLGRLEAERSSSTARALHAQETERHRIAQELHDEIGQSLTAVLLGLKHVADAAPPALADDLRAVQQTTRTALEEVRRIAQRLRPGMLSDLGLLPSISALASELSARTGIRVERGFAPGLPPLGSDAELVVYRVAQEALTNVARHSNASTVELGLSRRGDRVCLRVADDGTGQGKFVPGAGIQGMHERAQMVGGHLRTGPRPGGGSEVVLEVPIR